MTAHDVSIETGRAALAAWTRWSTGLMAAPPGPGQENTADEARMAARQRFSDELMLACDRLLEGAPEAGELIFAAMSVAHLIGFLLDHTHGRACSACAVTNARRFGVWLTQAMHAAEADRATPARSAQN